MTAKAKGAQPRGRAQAKQKPAKPDEAEQQAAAIAHEEAIRVEADAIWGDELRTLDGPLLRKLRPLLRKPIPTGFIEHLPNLPGKPYESTGVKSAQVQMDRLDNVLGPENWGYTAKHSDDGKLCHVRTWVGTRDEPTLVERDSWGGVQQGTGEGNIRKGAFTNAAKLALARLGPGWEVYVGAADFDPDTDPDAAKAQATAAGDGGEPKMLSEEKVAALEKVLAESGIERQHIDAKLRAFGVDEVGKLTKDQGIALYEWITGQQQPADTGETGEQQTLEEGGNDGGT